MKIRNAIVLTALMWLCLASGAEAFLRENKAAIASEYGDPVSHGKHAELDEWVYRSKGYEVTVDFQDGLSARELFSKAGSDNSLSEDALQAFLRAHSDGKAWHKNKPDKDTRMWERPGAIAMAFVDKVRGSEFLIMTSGNAEPSTAQVAYSTPAQLTAVATFKGTGDKNTDPFQIAKIGGFYVNYRNSSGYRMFLTVYAMPGKRFIATASVAPGREDHTFVSAGAGSYFLEIVCQGGFAVGVAQ